MPSEYVASDWEFLKLKNLKRKTDKIHVHIVEAVTHGMGAYLCVKTSHGKPTQIAENT